MLALPDNIVGPINTAHWEIEGVPAGHAMVPWRRCWDLLAKAVERFSNARERWTSEALLYEIMTEKAQLWIAWSRDRRRVEGVIITRIFDKPEMAPNKVCECPLD